MAKTGISKVELKNCPDSDEYEADLWKDDETGELSISLPNPWDGITSSRDARRLGTTLQAWAERMKRRGQ